MSPRTKGGSAGSHVVPETPPILVAPATGSELNTVSVAIIPVACWRVDDIRFEFDSSVVMPGVKTELDELKKLRTQHPGAPMSVFGHADPVGSDAYNKALSGRRATAIYALLTRDTALWEDLFSNTLGNDRWGLPALQTMQDTLDAAPGGAGRAPRAKDAEKNPGLRKTLFEQYMNELCGPDLKVAKTDFLGRGADAGGKADFQGCSEFNPVLLFSEKEQQRFDAATDKSERNAANSPNRRVMVLLFRKGSKVVPSKWPCPRAKEGTAGCEKRFWSDGQTRRSRRLPDAERRFPDTRDTFACRFYQRLTTSSPCEDIPVLETAKLEFVLDGNGDRKIDASDPATTFLRMGLWDNAFDPPPAGSGAGAANVLANDVAEDKNFVGADTRRFYLRVTDPNASGRVKVNWRTLKEDNSDLDRPGDQSLTLLETQTGSSVFVSRALMLVTDTDDQNQETDSGLAAGDANAGKRKHGEADHRIRKASLRGFVEAEYQPKSGPKIVQKLPVFNRDPDDRRTLPLHIFVMRRTVGGQGVIPTAAGSAVFTRDLRIIRETYERIGMSVTTSAPRGTAEANIVRDGGDALVLVDPPAGVNSFAVDDAAEQAIGAATPADPNTIRVYYAGRLTSGNRGEAAPMVDFAARTDAATAFVNGGSFATAMYSPAHESGHVLTNKSNAVNGGHYNAPAAPPGNKLLNDQNLMRNATSTSEGVLESKRLWDAADQDGVNEFTSMRASQFTRAFA
ncbi:MAG TPA: OmpA family protein [Methylomirabilota bacterium]